jgi:hypothetical protein
VEQFSLCLLECHQKKESPTNKRRSLRSTTNTSQTTICGIYDVESIQCARFLRGECVAAAVVPQFRDRFHRRIISARFRYLLRSISPILKRYLTDQRSRFTPFAIHISRPPESVCPRVSPRSISACHGISRRLQLPEAPSVHLHTHLFPRQYTASVNILCPSATSLLALAELAGNMEAEVVIP